MDIRTVYLIIGYILRIYSHFLNLFPHFSLLSTRLINHSKTPNLFHKFPFKISIYSIFDFISAFQIIFQHIYFLFSSKKYPYHLVSCFSKLPEPSFYFSGEPTKQIRFAPIRSKCQASDEPLPVWSGSKSGPFYLSHSGVKECYQELLH